MHSLATLGVDPLALKGKQYCSLVIAHMVDEELPSKELDWLSKRFLGSSKVDHIKELAAIYGWANIPSDIMGPYGEEDPDLHRRLKNVLWPKLVQQGLDAVYWHTEEPLTRSLYQMEQRGVGTNTDLASNLYERGRGRMATIQRHLKWNPASTRDIGNYLLNELNLPVLALTPKGKPSFNKIAMEGYDELLQASSDPTAQLIAEYRGWQKATSSLYLPILERVGPDGRIRTSFKEHGTVTSRLSAVDPNLQQIPRSTAKAWNGKAKACFPSGIPGYLHYGWDYSQIELRLGACYSGEPILVNEFRKEKADPFKALTPLIFGAYNEDLRHKTKNCLVYPSLYGAQLKKVTALLGPNVDAPKIYQNYLNSIPKMTALAKDTNNLMARQKYISYWDGRRRHIKNPQDSYKAWNSLLQGGGAQLVKKAINKVHEFADEDCFPVLTVHDEISFCIREEALPDYEPKIIKAMTEWPEYNFPLRFPVEGKEWK
jgi:DNA polymerase-1